MSFWKELSRRNVFKVGIAYAVAAWLIIHPVDIIFPILHLPEWSITLVTAFLIILFPLVLLFAWAYEITSKGLKKTKDVPISKSITHVTGKRLNYIITGLLVVAVVYLVFDKYYYMRGAATEVAPVITDEVKDKKSIAVLPFVDLSPAKDQEYFVDGLSEELLDCITQISNLRVTARTSSFSFKGSDKTVKEIASVLGVDNILEGSVRKAGNALRITAQLVRAADSSHIWSKTYDRELKDIFAVQEDIAKTVAKELRSTLGINRSHRSLGGTANTAAYELYLTAKGQYNNFQTERALGSIDAALMLDPEFALAWALKSNVHNGLIQSVPDNRIVEELDAGLKAAEKAIELEPNLAEGHYSLGVARTNRGDWIEAESSYQKALELINDPSLRHEVEFPFHYEYVGHFEKAKAILETQLKIDPLNRGRYQQYISILGLHGDMQRAKEENEVARRLFGDEWRGDLVIFSLRFASGDVVAKDELPKEVSTEFDAMGIDLTSSEKSLAVYRQLYTGMGDKLPIIGLVGISMYAAYFGDPEFAMDLIEKAGIQRVDAMSNLWCPVMKEVRQLPRFKKFVKGIGLVDYWNKFGWPDICHQLDNGDFECD